MYFTKEANRIEIKIPKDISTYKESIALGLSMRQFLCSVNLTLERFIIAYVRSEWLVPQTRYYASENFHYKLIFAPNPPQKKKAKKKTSPKTIKE